MKNPILEEQLDLIKLLEDTHGAVTLKINGAPSEEIRERLRVSFLTPLNVIRDKKLPTTEIALDAIRDQVDDIRDALNKMEGGGKKFRKNRKSSRKSAQRKSNRNNRKTHKSRRH
jgi:hypothetical protein